MQIFEGGSDTVDTLLFGAPNQNVINYVTSQFESFISNVSESSKKFYDKAISSIDNLINGDVINKAKAILKNSKDILSHINIIKFTNNLEEIQAASPYMQRWIMAEETIADLFSKQRCSGFVVDDKTPAWLDNDPGVTGKYKYDSMLLNHGMVKFNDDHSFSVTEFDLDDDLKLRNESMLSFTDKVAIHDMHDCLKYYVSQGKDPTDPNGGML